MKFNYIFLLSALLGLGQASPKPCSFLCGVNTIGGCCSQFFTNEFDQYAFGTGCQFAESVPIRHPSSATPTKWKCADSALIPGCCSASGSSTPPSPWLCNTNVTLA